MRATLNPLIYNMVKVYRRQNVFTVSAGSQKARFDLQSNNSPSFQREVSVEWENATVYIAAFTHYPGSFELVVAVFTPSGVSKYRSTVFTPVSGDVDVVLYEFVGDDPAYEIRLANEHGSYVLHFEENRLEAVKAIIDAKVYAE